MPRYVAAVDAFADVPVPLLPEERRVAATLRAGRREEFATVRHCARLAGQRLGVAPFPLVPGATSAPGWPPGVVGSMTHCRGYRAAAVAHAASARAVGIDAEPHLALPAGMLARIARPEEQEQHRALVARDGGVHWDRLLFCAKEAVYKVWSPLTGAWLGFLEATVSFSASSPAFRARIHRAPPEGAGAVPTVLDGTWLARRGLLVAAIVVPNAPAGPGRACPSKV